MLAITRTRSQHFVHSPRRNHSPLKVRNTSALSRQPIKKRRLAANPFAPTTNIIAPESDDENESQEEAFYSPEGSTKRNIVPLSSEIGDQTVNKSRSKSALTRRDTSRKGKDRETKHNVNRATSIRADVFASEEEESSPRKRKRSDQGTSESGDSGSWVEMDEDEAEPEFIAESDQHLIDDAPAYALHRLRKAELFRLWKVAGMWTAEEGEEGEDSTSPTLEDDEAGGMGKKELVDGLIAGRQTAASSSSGGVASREIPSMTNGTRSLSSSARDSSPSPLYAAESPSAIPDDADVTPKAVPRTRASKPHARIDGTSKPSRRSNAGRSFREKLFRGRSKSMGGEKQGRKARFGDNIQSPANGLFHQHTRRSSMSSSNYTTTDTSNPGTPNKRTPRRVRRPVGFKSQPVRRQTAKSTRFTSEQPPPEDEAMEDTASPESEEDGEVQRTPLLHRLRPRTRSSLVLEERHSAEDELDKENSEDDGDVESISSPGPSARLRSRDRLIDSDKSMRNRRITEDMEEEAAEDLAEEEEDDDGMEVDGEDGSDEDETIIEDEGIEEDDDGNDTPQSGPSRPSRRDQVSPSPAPETSKRHRRRNSRLIASSSSSDSAGSESSMLSPPPPSSLHVQAEPVDGEIMRTTRSGKLFGVWQSRRRKLRQEAIDDPDMEVEEEEEDDQEDSDEDEEVDSFEPDVDLASATIASLTRLLRDELVQLCETRGIEVGGTKPQLAKALLRLRDEQASDDRSAPSSQSTAKPSSSKSNSKHTRRKPNGSSKIIHAVASHVHVSGKTTPVLMRDHVHAQDPATPHEEPQSGDSKKTGDGDLNLDLQELGLEDSVIRPDLLQKLDRIGSGGFKDVYVGKYRGRKVAISEFREHLSEMDIRELKLLSEFSHPNIVKFRGICIPEENTHVPCMLVSELCENGDLFDYIRNVPTPPLKRLLRLMLDIAKGLEYLHTHTPSIIHRDCKSSNMLINRNGQVKVGDFGLARVKISTRSMIRSLVGTVNWQAPELWHPAPRYDYKVDVFSVGMVYWEMMSGWTGEKKYPWEGHNEHYIYDAVGAKQRRPPIAGLRKHWGNEPVALMERMWHQDPGERPTMTDVVTDLEVLYAAAPKG